MNRQAPPRPDRTPAGTDPAPFREAIERDALAPEEPLLDRLRAEAALDEDARAALADRTARLVRDIRAAGRPGLMESFLAEYGLSTDEGVALMCLAEALLRVPDPTTMDALIEDKIAPSDWGRHLGRSASPLVNASTWALMLTGRVLDDTPPGIAGRLRGAVRRLGEPVIRAAVARVMREMGRQFVLGETIEDARARARPREERGQTHSYDMLGEAARTMADADAYHDAYARAIAAVATDCSRGGVARNPGISVKLSALHPRYEEAQRDRVLSELAPRLLSLAQAAAAAGMGLNIDAEEQDRLALSLDVIETVLADPSLAGWDGFGVVVQAYGRRAGAVIDWLDAQAQRLGRRLMVRLVKGAYWDSEIKRAQVEGLPDFPVFTAKAATDISFLACARRLVARADRLYPQFATHNAHSAAAILHMTRQAGLGPDSWEFQRLHGMGEALHDLLAAQEGTRLRIYAPVGAHRDLLAYLVRRLLENGANSSFVNRIVDASIPPEQVAPDPFAPLPPRRVRTAPELFLPARLNSRGRDLSDRATLSALEAARAPFRDALWQAAPILADDAPPAGPAHETREPATGRPTGRAAEAAAQTVARAAALARPWDAPLAQRAATLRRASDLLEAHEGEILALLAREAGKTLPDAVGELREAVDFLRFYAAEAERTAPPPGGGIWACISPWNFPLAIFTGQIAAALAAGNAVLAKPAPQTPLIAARATAWLHEAGVPRAALQLLPGGAGTGAALTARPELAGVAFTGSTATAQAIRRTLAEGPPGRRLIAETGGINAMVVDSTALPEQAVRDVIASAFRSAGQRCSALRCLLVQEDVAGGVLEMLRGAMAELRLGDPWALSTDIGPVIDEGARRAILAHVEQARAEGRILAELGAPSGGTFVAPVAIRVPSIAAVTREVFGPVLHIATFRAEDLAATLRSVNATGYGLTFGLHTRIDDRVQQAIETVRAGNIYVNRNQIGAVVGSQPFGGEGLSGTGPKAGGPHYLPRFGPFPPESATGGWSGPDDPARVVALLIEADRAPAPRPEPLTMPGPTGESNRLHHAPRAALLCLGPGEDAAHAQAEAVRSLGGRAVEARGTLDPAAVAGMDPLGGVLWWGDEATASALDRALAAREGPLVPLLRGRPDAAHVLLERHVCIDTTAAGGNASLLAEVAS
ncbi:bifunctional proline dehydrogenase/L-glutamate gamma-semialdehyde dehydrogenase PutA [Rubellimicrobium sp. CFH 75288]|uniref:bifunctional proline dehydrogenase/L-glutamate gamma-semialdehyde dehydrogenase PutA n=1 Tax=Rubellimicrobium sp. CFH 75288 TaxID=2697034 RepID=UPI0014137832|nr:bifunctional proline dehydrogenase/L-glutamate gamma-semialdehyde dehydrogenase PutA [Rubellimicrobium sp. CFH 75288]NAZ36193.1 bifunctional proline dehydrogenase/L-glutamate gamma-semialdehyde dehydrogenase PutA [Rubellimicrobium sp. CFH 75288]